MSFQITITRKDTKPVTKRGEHTVIGEAPWSAEDMKDEKSYAEQTESFLKRRPTKHVYGYAPSYEGFETTETEVLKQTVDELDLAAVIKAINKL